MEFLQAFGTVFGIIAGGGVLVLVFKIGISWGGIRADVADTNAAVTRIEPQVREHAEALRTVNQTLHGPLGDNGLYQDVRQIKAQLQELPGTPKRRRTDRRKAS